jgi:undecaprenyl-diphosphatase
LLHQDSVVYFSIMTNPFWMDLLRLDARWSERLRVAQKPGLLHRLAVFFAHSGDSWFWGIGLLALLLWPAAAMRWLALLLLACVFVLAALVLALKFTIRRQRPPGEWGAVYRKTDPHSFPSGHAARAFMLAALMTAFGPLWLAALLWLWAPLVSLARVSLGVHFLSDVLAGAVLGLAFAGLVIVMI